MNNYMPTNSAAQKKWTIFYKYTAPQTESRRNNLNRPLTRSEVESIIYTYPWFCFSVEP